MRTRHRPLVTFFLAACAAPAVADSTWDVHGGLWSVAGNWIGGVPGAADNAFVTNTTRLEEVVVDINASINALTLSDFGLTPIADSITLTNGRTMTLNGGGILNDGQILLQGNGGFTTLTFSGAQTIAGRGAIVLSDDSLNRITTNNTVLQHGNNFGHELRGAGSLLANTGGLWNLSTIRQQGANALVIDPNGLGVDNDGLLVAEGSGGLTLTAGTFDNAGGEIRAANASVARFIGATVNGGVLSSGGSGVLETGNSTFDGVTVTGAMMQTNGSTASIRNGLLLLGTWSLGSTGAFTQMSFVGEQSVTGTGTIVFSDTEFNRLVNNNTVTTLGNGITLRGAGRVLDNTGGLVNQGSIIAEGTNALTIDPNGNGFVNEGLLRAAGAGGLVLTSGIFDLASPVEVQAGSALLVNAATLNGGALDIAAGVAADVRSTTLNGVTINGDVLQANGINNTVINGLTLNGTWTLASSGAFTDLLFNGTQTLGGAGTLVLGDAELNRLVNNNTVTTIGSDVTVRGAGRLLDNSGGLVNLGTILAEGNTALTIDPNGLDFLNQGSLRAVGAGGLRLVNGIFDLDSALDVDAGSALTVVSSTLNDGVVNVANGVVADIRSSTLNGMTVNGDVLQANGINNTITGGLMLNGTWTLDSTGAFTDLFFNGTQTLGGTGTLVLGDAELNRLVNNNTVTTIGSDVTVRGAGRLLDNSGGLVNLGTILAEGNTALTIDPNGLDFLNQGSLRAVGAGGLRLVAGTFHLDSALDVEAGSALSVVSSILNTGTVNIANGVVADIRSSTLNGMTVNGDVLQANGINNTITNGLTLNGTWTLGSNGAFTDLFVSGAQTLGGNGTLVLGDAALNRVVNNNTVTTIGANMTVRGAGRLLDNSGGLVNLGSIIAEGDTALTIDPNGLGFVNQGSLRAVGAGGLRLVGGTFHLDSALDVEAGSALSVVSSTLDNGTVNIANGVTADIRSSTLNGMTINGDVLQANGISNTITNGLTLNGTWTLASGGGFTDLTVSGAQTLGGSGTLLLSDAPLNRVLNNNTVTTIGADLTVRGAGRLLDNSGGMINEGTVIADGTNALVLNPNGLGFENRGVVRAQGAGGIASSDDYRQTAGSTEVLSVFDITNRTLIVDGGTLTGGGTIIGDVANNAGVVGPGNSPGMLSIEGDYTQGATATLLIEIAGLGDFDVLSVSGSALLGGDLAVDLLGNYLPQVGQSFDILLANDVNGVFSNGQFVDAGRAVFEILYLEGLGGDIVRLTTVSAVPLPAGAWLLLSALAGLVARRRRTT